MDTSPRPLPRRALPPLQAPSESKSNISKSIRDDADGTLPLDTSSSSMPRSRPPRQKKKARQSSQMNQQLQDEGASNREETQLENGDQVSEMNSTVQTKRARTRRRQANRNKSSRTSTAPQVVTNGYALTNMLSEEDVVPVDHIENLSAMTTLPGVAGGGGNSQPTEKVFVQTTSGFASHTEEWLANRQIAAAQKVSFANNEEQLVTQTSQVALSFHRGFIFLVFLIHGILAGLAIWEVVVAFALSSTGPDNFFTQYSSLAQPTQIVFYILIALCLISALDRYNFAKPGGNMLLDLIRIEPGAWTVIAYLLAFAFNNGLSGVDYWLGQIAPSLQLNQTVSPATPAYLNENPSGSLSTWHAINVLRAVFSALGWILLAVYPTEDETAKHWWFLQCLATTYGVTNRESLLATHDNPAARMFVSICLPQYPTSECGDCKYWLSVYRQRFTSSTSCTRCREMTSSTIGKTSKN